MLRKLRAMGMRLFRAGRTQNEFEAELASHIALHTEEGVRAGLSPEEARRRAMIRLGGAGQVQQAMRERDAARHPAADRRRRRDADRARRRAGFGGYVWRRPSASQHALSRRAA